MFVVEGDQIDNLQVGAFVTENILGISLNKNKSVSLIYVEFRCRVVASTCMFTVSVWTSINNNPQVCVQ